MSVFWMDSRAHHGFQRCALNEALDPLHDQYDPLGSSRTRQARDHLPLGLLLLSSYGSPQTNPSYDAPPDVGGHEMVHNIDADMIGFVGDIRLCRRHDDWYLSAQIDSSWVNVWRCPEATRRDSSRGIAHFRGIAFCRLVRVGRDGDSYGRSLSPRHTMLWAIPPYQVLLEQATHNGRWVPTLRGPVVSSSGGHRSGAFVRHDCAICLDVLHPDDDKTALPCADVFHTACLVEFFDGPARPTRCPLCRTDAWSGTQGFSQFCSCLVHGVPHDECCHMAWFLLGWVCPRR